MKILERKPRGQPFCILNQAGFSMIELVLVVSIIGVVSAIGAVGAKHYQDRAQDTQAESALRNLMTAQEGYYSVNNTYASCGISGYADCTTVFPELKVNSDVRLVAQAGGNGVGADQIWGGSACNRKSTSGWAFVYNNWYGRMWGYYFLCDIYGDPPVLLHWSGVAQGGWNLQ